MYRVKENIVMDVPTQCERTKNLYIDEQFITALREACNWKKAERLPENSYYELYVGDDILNQMTSSDHQLIWGRRGTGKTHLLKAFTQKINSDPNSKDIAFYISCDDINVMSPIDINFSNDDEKIKYLARETYICFLVSLTEQIIDEYNKILLEKNYFLTMNRKEKQQLIKTVDNCLIELYENCTQGIPIIVDKKVTETVLESTERTKEKLVEVSGEGKFSFIQKAMLAIGGKLNRKNKKLNSNNKTEESKTEKVYSFSFSKTKDTIRKLLTALNINTLYICIDELWLIDKKRDLCLQPIFLDYVRQALINSPNISIKIASIREVTKLNSKASAKNNFGLQSGHDIFEIANLDTLYTERKDVIKKYRTILAQRVNYFSENNYSENYIINTVFKNERDFISLICLTHYIPRNFIIVLQRCLNVLNYDLQHKTIHSYLVQNIVVNNYLEDKRSNLPMNSDSLYNLINNYIDTTRKYFFLISTSQLKRLKAEIDNLVYIELIHQIPSSMLPREIMNNYKGFYIDAGKYLHALNYDFNSNRDELYNFSFVLPETLKNNYFEYIIDLDKIESNFIECENCGNRISKNHPVFEKFRACPICAFKY